MISLFLSTNWNFLLFTEQNSEFKEVVAIKDKENTELRQLVLELRTEIAEIKKNPENIHETIQVVAMATEAFANISQTVQKEAAKLAVVNNKLLQSAGGTSESNASSFRSPMQNRTPSNVSRIRPIIRTPNGLMQSVSISLPRIDHSIMFSAAERIVNSTTISENGHSTASSNATEETAESEERSEGSEIEATGTTLNMVPDTTRDSTVNTVVPLPIRLPRYSSEPPFLGFDDNETETRPNPELIPSEHDDAASYYEGLSIIQEVTEVEYTVNPSRNNAPTTDDETTGGEEVTSHQTSRVSLRANKENTLRSQRMSIAQASCSTPYNRQDRSSEMPIAKVVLQQLNMEKIKSSEKQQARTRHESESSEQSTDSGVTTRKPAARKRKDSEMSVNTDDTDDESGQHTGRPKRRATPTFLKEPALNTKMRRAK